jgi:hypothetical protein
MMRWKQPSGACDNALTAARSRMSENLVIPRPFPLCLALGSPYL